MPALGILSSSAFLDAKAPIPSNELQKLYASHVRCPKCGTEFLPKRGAATTYLESPAAQWPLESPAYQSKHLLVSVRARSFLRPHERLARTFSRNRRRALLLRTVRQSLHPWKTFRESMVLISLSRSPSLGKSRFLAPTSYLRYGALSWFSGYHQRTFIVGVQKCSRASFLEFSGLSRNVEQFVSGYTRQFTVCNTLPKTKLPLC
jgi:hypothetical protein